MRLITIRAPAGHGQQVATTAFEAGISEVGVHRAAALRSDGQERAQDVVEVATSIPKAKDFIERLMSAPYYDPGTYSLTSRHPESIFGNEPQAEETYPVVRPSPDVYAELWQFVQVTFSLAGRVFLSAVLVAYGMVEDHLPLIIAGLLFLPYHHHMIGVALGAVLRERRFLGQALWALLVSTVLIVLAGVAVGLALEPPIKFDEFGSPVSGVIISMVIGVAAGLGSIDAAGRRELIGLAATAHIAVHPAWFGLKLIFGFEGSGELSEHLLMFLLNTLGLVLAAGVTYALTVMQGGGIRRFEKKMHNSGA
ncbi:hypothetical protein [Deinococcus peraridilitoris]|uniref:DUF389 domain-containing protein n=1 Tax=Deinococcus peraridilitoris (strain DSM 19664 / LMG 22246 / CIP 109416 / KR-200) TaxID=937777 RepID=L0A6Y2_DEIPD|nr:hypothetical protein [Deinococcus peraridilitoris]AFZ69608.1 hypothetical protein Deipe_4259 [Deinococcus peraridilitoris DSM 19664]